MIFITLAILTKINHQVNSLNPLYLIINKVVCFLGEKNGVKYFKIDKGDNVLNKWNQVFGGIKYHIEKIINDEFGNKFPDVVYDSDFDKIRFVTSDLLPLGKLIYFPTLTVVIICVFKQGDIFYPQVYLDDAMYQL